MRSSWKWLLLLCGLLYFATAGGHFSSTDEEDLFQNTQLLFEQFQLMLGSPPTLISETTQLQERAPQEIGQSLLSVPLYWLGVVVTQGVDSTLRSYLLRAFLTTFTIAITLGTIGVLFFWRPSNEPESAGWLIAGSYAFATFAWPYAKTYYREPLAALCILLAIRYADQFRLYRIRRDLLLAITILIFGVFTKTVTLLIVPWWLICLLGDQIKDRKRFAQGILLLIVIGILGFASGGGAKEETIGNYLQELRFDIVSANSTFWRYGMYGLLFSTGKGLFLYAPPMIVSLFGIMRFGRRQPFLAIAIFGIFFSFLLFYSTRRGWHGGACWGPRYLLPILPLLMLPMYETYSSWRDPACTAVRKKITQVITVILLMIGVTVQWAAVSIYPLNYYWEVAQQGLLAPSEFDGGPRYLESIYFQPELSPILGHLRLANERIPILLNKQNRATHLQLVPDVEKAWQHFATVESLDFWWLYLTRGEIHQ